MFAILFSFSSQRTPQSIHKNSQEFNSSSEKYVKVGGWLENQCNQIARSTFAFMFTFTFTYRITLYNATTLYDGYSCGMVRVCSYWRLAYWFVLENWLKVHLISFLFQFSEIRNGIIAFFTHSYIHACVLI